MAATVTDDVAVPSGTQQVRLVNSLSPKTHGLCGTEIEPLDEESTLSTPADLHALGASVPTLDEVQKAIEAHGLSSEEVDVIEMAKSAISERDTTEKELSEAEDPSGESPEDTARQWAYRSEQLLGLGQPEKALQAAEEAHRLAPSFVTTEQLSTALTAMGRRGDAERLLEDALAHTEDPDERAWHFSHLGFLCSGYDDACADRAEKALSAMDDKQEMVGFLRGIRNADQGDYEASKAAFSSLKDADSSFSSLLNLASVTTNLGQTEEAKHLWVSAMQQASNPSDRASVLEGVGSSYLEEGDTVSAWIAGTAALTVTGSSATSSGARGLLALTALNMGDLEEARSQVSLSRAANPHDDLEQFYWFANPAEGESMRALIAEVSGDKERAKEAWLSVARSSHPKLGYAAKVALGRLCAPS